MNPIDENSIKKLRSIARDLKRRNRLGYVGWDCEYVADTLESDFNLNPYKLTKNDRTKWVLHQVLDDPKITAAEVITRAIRKYEKSSYFPISHGYRRMVH